MTKRLSRRLMWTRFTASACGDTCAKGGVSMTQQQRGSAERWRGLGHFFISAHQ